MLRMESYKLSVRHRITEEVALCQIHDMDIRQRYALLNQEDEELYVAVR